MGCPPVRGYNPRALASGLSYVQVNKHGITILYTYISVDLAHHEIFRAKVGKGGINSKIFYFGVCLIFLIVLGVNSKCWVQTYLSKLLRLPHHRI